MPANSKYLTSSGWQRFGKISAGILGGYLVAQTAHLALAAYLDHVVILITATFSLFIVWAVLIILAFLARNPWKIWSLYLAISIVFSVFVAILGILVGPILISEFFPKFTEAVDAIRIMSVALIPTTIAVILEAEFLGKEKSGVVLIGTAILVTSLIIGMIVLGSLMGIEGIAYSFVIAHTAKTSFYLIKKLRIVTD